MSAAGDDVFLIMKEVNILMTFTNMQMVNAHRRTNKGSKDKFV